MATSKPPRLLLDTHIWLRYQGLSGELRPAALPHLHEAAAEGSLFVAPISIWEMAMLEKAGKLTLQASVAVWTRQALSKPGINLVGFTSEIAIDSVQLPEPVHKDPADRILLATARVEHLTLVTRDEKMLEFAARTHLAHLVA